MGPQGRVTGQATSCINFAVGVVRANSGIFMLSTEETGKLSVVNLPAATNHIFLAANGYFQ